MTNTIKLTDKEAQVLTSLYKLTLSQNGYKWYAIKEGDLDDLMENAQAYIDALAADPVSAFGGVLISNSEIGTDVAELINNLFCEVVIAPKFSEESLNILKQKKIESY